MGKTKTTKMGGRGCLHHPVLLLLLLIFFEASVAQDATIGLPTPVSDPHVVGGVSPDQAVDFRAMDAASFAVGEIKKRSNSLGETKLGNVLKVRTQVVAGINYFMDLEVVTDGHTQVHHVTVWDQFGNMHLTRDDIADSA